MPKTTAPETYFGSLIDIEVQASKILSKETGREKRKWEKEEKLRK
jgi:hypothetical protein